MEYKLRHMQKPFKALISFLAGILLVFAFSPFGIRFLAILSPALLLWCLLDTNKKTAFAHGLFFGCGFFGAGAYWIYISIHTFGEAPLAVSLLITTLFILALSLFTALSTYLFSCFKTNLSFRCLALFPSIWVLAEWLRSWVLTGFPWLFLGYSQVDTQLRAFAPVIGVYGLSFLLVFISAMLIVLLKGARKEKFAMLLLLGLVWLGTKALMHANYTNTLKPPISVSLIQGNIPQSLKWDAEQAAKTLKTYEELNRTQMRHTLIVWPEAAVPIFKSQARTYLNRLNTHLKQKDQILITGIPVDQWPNFYNGIVMLGIAQGEYFKIHLVPFGEYYPLKWLVSPLFDYLKIPMSDLTPGPSAQPLLDAHGLSIAPFVCYEIAYPQQVLTQAKQAELLITLTDDSWFGNSVAAAQHLEIAQLRALETQRYLLFSTNSGISAIINPNGELIAHLPMNQTGIIHGQIHAVQGLTPLMRWGYTPLAVLILGLLLIGIRLQRR